MAIGAGRIASTGSWTLRVYPDPAVQGMLQLAVLLTLTCVGIAADEGLPVPENVVVRCSVDADEFLLGDNVLVHFTVTPLPDRQVDTL